MMGRSCSIYPFYAFILNHDVQVFHKGSQDSNSSQHSENSASNGKAATVVENLNNGRGSSCLNPTLDQNGQNGSGDQNSQRRDSDQNGRNGRGGQQLSDAVGGGGGGRSGNKVSETHLLPFFLWTVFKKHPPQPAHDDDADAVY